MAPVLVKLSQGLAADKALSQIKLSRTPASYKMVDGMGHTFAEETFSNLRGYPFSLNVDESTSSSNKKVLSMLVSYFNEELNDIVVEHLVEPNQHNARLKQCDEWEQIRTGDKDPREALSHSA